MTQGPQTVATGMHIENGGRGGGNILDILCGLKFKITRLTGYKYMFLQGIAIIGKPEKRLNKIRAKRKYQLIYPRLSKYQYGI